MRKKEIYIPDEKDIAELLANIKSPVAGNFEIHVGIPHEVNAITDGRIAEEYEDLPTEAPCRVDGLRCDLRTMQVSFHMHTAFTTHFPLMSNDWYNFRVMSDQARTKVYEYLQTLPKVDKPKNYVLAWQRKAYDYLRNLKVNMKIDNGDTLFNFKHMIDCELCCHNYKSLKEADSTITALINKFSVTTGILIRIMYPNLDMFKQDMYLCWQTHKRQLICGMFIHRYINKLYVQYPINYINWLLSFDPDEVIGKNNVIKKRYLQSSFVEIIKPERTTHLKIESDVESTDELVNIFGLNYLYPYIYKERFSDDQSKEIPVYINDIAFEIGEFKKPFIMCCPSYPVYADDLLGGMLFGTDVKLVLYMTNALTGEMLEPVKTDMDSSHIPVLYEIKSVDYPSDIITNDRIPTYSFYERITNLPIQFGAKYAKFIEGAKKNPILVEHHHDTPKFYENRDRSLTLNFDGVNWAKSNKTNRVTGFYVEDGEFNATYPVTDIIYGNVPKGWRLPTFEELDALLKKHPFKQVKTQSKRFGHAFKNDLGIEIKLSPSDCSYQVPVFITSTMVGNQPMSQYMLTYPIYPEYNVLKDENRDAEWDCRHLEDTFGVVLLVKE